MPDPQELSSPEPPDLSATLGASLNSVWNRYADAPPTESTVELAAGVVKWSVPKSSADELKEGIANRNGQDGGPVRTMAGFERETSLVVAHAMHRKIAARFSKRTRDGVATEVFVLETTPRKN